MQQNRKRIFSENGSIPNGDVKKQKQQFNESFQANGHGNQADFSRQLVRLGGGEKWYENTYTETAETRINHADQVYLEKLERAKKLLKRDVELHEQTSKINRKSEDAWLTSVVEKGTMSDRLSAVQLKFQQAPIHSLGYLEKLVLLFEKKKMRDSVNLFKCLKEIMIKELLPSTRKLTAFDMRPLDKLESLSSGNVQTANKRLIFWKFEDDLKKLYQRIVVAGQELASIQVEGVAEQACIILADLLILRPEQEQFLLNALVNKIGHPKKKVDVTVTQQLERLLEKHPNMRLTVAVELERLIFRKNIIERTQFYALHSLNRIPLRSGDDELALKILRTQFGLFKVLILKNATSSRLLEMCVRGANRAFPFAKEKANKLEVEMDDFYKLVHTAPKLTTSLSILSLLYQMQTHSANLTDRFYSVFYQRILRVHSSSADPQFFRLLREALKTDAVDERVRAFIKRLLQLSLNTTASFAAASLLTYNELLKEKPNLIKLVDEDQMETFTTKLEGVGYKPEARNPLFAHADQSADTELRLLAKHFHPSVAHFAQSILEGKPIVYKGDPLVDFTLIRFLDRFAFKNPKLRQKEKSVKNEDDDEEAPAKVQKRLGYEPKGAKRLAPGSADYARVMKRDIPDDERFIHRFSSLKMMKQQKTKPSEIKKEDGNDDADEVASVDSDDFDRIVERFEPGEANEEFELEAVSFVKE